MQRRTFVVLTLAGLCLAGLSGLASSADARCAPVSLRQEVRRADSIVEAVLERAGETAHFRTVTVWKGGAQAPATFTLGARQGRAHWPWHEASNVGQRYLLFLYTVPDGHGVSRCGASGEATDAKRSQMRAAGLRPQDR